MSETNMQTFQINRENYDHYNEENLAFKAPEGINEDLVRYISKQKSEPEWMLKKRLEGLKAFNELKLPNWGPDLSKLDLSKIHFFMRPNAKSNAKSWDDVPADIRKTYDRLGIPEAEKTVLAGVGAQYESQVVYHSLKKELEDQGVVFLDCDEALKKYPELMQKYFMTTCVPVRLHKFSALHAAVWSGGTFIYVPKGVKVKAPLQAYFRMNAKKGGQFEHTLIIVDEDAEVSYLEGCSAPVYEESSLHAGCVEIHVLKNARARYSSIENWSRNTYNLNTKRAVVYEDGIVEWINGNMGCLTGDSKVYTNPEGPVNINSLKKGDKVFALDEANKKFVRAKVKGVIYSGDKKVYRMRAAGREIEASSNHPFLRLEHQAAPVNKKKGEFISRWVALEDLKKGDIIAISKSFPDFGQSYKLPEIDLSERKTISNNQYKKFEMKTNHLYGDFRYPDFTNEDLMWFSGLYLGDGNLWRPEKGGAKINIAIHETSDLRNPLLEIVENLFNYKVQYKKDRYIIINSNVLAELIEKLGFSGTAKNKKIPKWVFSLPLSQRMAFLAGLFDSDGHVGRTGIYITSISKELLEGIKYLAISCGIGVSRIFDHGKKGKTIILGRECNMNDSFRILLNGKKVKEIPTRSTNYKNKIVMISTRRNFSRAKGWNFYSKTSEELGFARIDVIDYVGIKPTYDIEVEGYHNFISNGIVVHNSHTTMLYPASILIGDRSKSDFIGIAFAGNGQNQDTGCKIIQIGKNTSSTITSKSISKDGGITSYRGLLSIKKGAINARSNVVCDALMMDNKSQSNTYPFMDVQESTVDVAHEATVGRISQEQIFYLMSRGLSEEQATQMIVSGFIEPVAKKLPLEYAVELNRLIELEMEGTLG